MRHLWVVEKRKGKKKWMPLYNHELNRSDGELLLSYWEIEDPWNTYRLVKYVPEVKKWL